MAARIKCDSTDAWASRRTPNNQACRKKLFGLRILLAEDLPDNQLLITRLLQASGAVVDVVENGLAAIEQAARQAYNLVLMDLQMPMLDGFGATIELRRHGFRMPIVVLTAHALREERDKCFAAGCDDHLTKPVNPQMLVRTVAYFTAKSSVDKATVRPGAGVMDAGPPAT